MGAGVGSLVQVPFHGRSIRGWVLGATDDVPSRILDVRKAVSPVRFFDDDMLELFRWVSERYVAPLAAVIARSHPPRVVSEEAEVLPGTVGVAGSQVVSSRPLVDHRNGAELIGAIIEGLGTFIVRPAPEDEVDVAVEAVATCLAGGRRAIVLVPEAAPMPATAAAVREAFGERVGMLLGGDRRMRYRRWLEILSGRFEVVVGTRPAVFAPQLDLGLMLVSRESHPAHREDRAPYHHVRDVSLRRAEVSGAACVLSAICPSVESTLLPATTVSPATRRWPPVEVVRPGPEGRAPRLVRALREAKRAFLLSPLHGYGVAQVCRACGNPAACAACGGVLRSEEGVVRCVVCESTGRCAFCGAVDFGIRRGGAERVEEWAAATATVRVRRVPPKGKPRLPVEGEVLVGGPEAIRDLGPGGLDLVAILDADLAERRPGLASRERALSTWMEAVGWARPSGRAIVQTEHPTDPAIQALVRGNPDRFHEDERRRRKAAGFPVGAAVFRIAGPPALETSLEALRPTTLLVSFAGDQTVCLLALEPDRVPELGRAVRELAARDLVTRVEAEPHL
jgi:primosomal protein N' (replication factor Y)